jgi:O-succinylbenzoate synthase
MEVHVFDLPLRHRFRGVTRRQGMLWETACGWAEWSPFLDYGPAEAATWLAAAREVAERGWPAPVRDRVPVNVTVPAVDPETAHRLVAESGCTTAKVKVAAPGDSRAAELARLEAARDALGRSGHLRVDANGAWDVAAAQTALAEFRRFGLEYAEQPCASVEELAELRRRLARRGVDVPIAADESIRRSGDPARVVTLEAADIAVLKVQPLGGVWRCLELAERLGLPVVVSSALETSVGLASGVALAAALPDLPYACGLNTARLLAADVTESPLIARGGLLPVGPVTPDPALLAEAAADAATTAFWRARLAEAEQTGPGPWARAT